MSNPDRTGNSLLARATRKWKSKYISKQSPIIIGGCPRSGTTLTRIILDSHPHIACGPESSLLAGRIILNRLATSFEIPREEIEALRQRAIDHAHFIELFFTDYATRHGKIRWAEKTPANVRHVSYVFRHFPNAKFLHVVRDGRDLVCSLRTHPKYRVINGERVPTHIRRPLRACIRQWLRDTNAGMSWRNHPNYMELRYEDLVNSPEPTMKRLCEFIGEPWSPELTAHDKRRKQNPLHFSPSSNAIEPLTSNAIGRWREDLTGEELELFYRLAKRQLLKLGYE